MDDSFSTVAMQKKPKRRSFLGWVVGLAVIAAIAGAAWWYRPLLREAPEARIGRFQSPGPTPVVVATIERGDMKLIAAALGTVTPLATVTVRTQISGQIIKIGFEEGQRVKQGDFLAQIDPRPYQNALDQTEGQLLRDQALLRNAETDLARYRRLYTQDSIARQQLDTQENLVRQYQGTVKTDEALVSNARLNLAYCRIVAPISGRVGLRLVDQGNYVQAGDAGGIVVITETQPITVMFTLPEDALPAILKRLRAGATLEATALDRRGVRPLATGILASVDNQIDPATGTVKLRAHFANADEGLFPNQFVNIRLLVDTRRDAMIAPTAAIQRGVPGTFVYTLNPDQTVAVRPVQLGPAEGERTVIDSGLEAGAVVVVDGADRLREGMRVVLPESAPASPRGQGQGQGQGRRPAGSGERRGQPAQ